MKDLRIMAVSKWEAATTNIYTSGQKEKPNNTTGTSPNKESTSNGEASIGPEQTAEVITEAVNKMMENHEKEFNETEEGLKENINVEDINKKYAFLQMGEGRTASTLKPKMHSFNLTTLADPAVLMTLAEALNGNRNRKKEWG